MAPKGGAGRYLVLYDGECGLCRAFAARAARLDRGGVLDLVPYQAAPSPPMSPELAAACARAVHVITPAGRRFRAGRAVVVIVRALGHRRCARILASGPVLTCLELGYWLVANNRSRLGWLARWLEPDRTSVRQA